MFFDYFNCLLQLATSEALKEDLLPSFHTGRLGSLPAAGSSVGVRTPTLACAVGLAQAVGLGVLQKNT